jgi:hypothetical protein
VFIGPPVSFTLRIDIAGQSHPLPKVIRVLRVKEPPTTPLVNRDSQRGGQGVWMFSEILASGHFDFGSVRSREAVIASEFYWQGAMFGVWSSTCYADVWSRFSISPIRVKLPDRKVETRILPLLRVRRR